MTMKLLTARDLGTEYRLVVHLDDTKLIEGNPDPVYVREFRWGKDMPLARVKAETKLLAQLELAKMTPSGGSVLAGEGADL